MCFGIAVGVGNTIGTGILRTPGEVAGYLGSASLLFAVWILGGVYALVCSSSVTELGTMLPKAGGWYVYSHRAFGERIGFVVGCCDWMVQSVAVAYLAAAMGEFSAGLFPALANHVRLVGVAGLALLAFLNWIGLRAGSRAQELTSLIKALGLLALVVACFTVSPTTSASLPSVLSNMLGEKHSLFLGLILVLQGVIVTYDGWYAPIYFVEEDLDPARNLPRSMIGTALSCIVIFLLVNAALFHILRMSHLAGSQMPAADAAMLVFGRYGQANHSPYLTGRGDQHNQRGTYVHTSHSVRHGSRQASTSQGDLCEQGRYADTGSASLYARQHHPGPNWYV